MTPIKCEKHQEWHVPDVGCPKCLAEKQGFVRCVWCRRKMPADKIVWQDGKGRCRNFVECDTAKMEGEK